jgi:hypothetical protein
VGGRIRWLSHTGECDPHHVASGSRQGGPGDEVYWHYPRITLQGVLTEAAALKTDDAAATDTSVPPVNPSRLPLPVLYYLI